MKLDAKQQKEVADSAERPEFEALPEGYYLAEVESIDLSEKPGQSGYHTWIVVWRILAPKSAAKRTIYDRRSLSPKAAWKLRELFDALGYEYDSDSDEMIGEKAVIELDQQPIGSGPRKGEMGNNVVGAYSADDQEYRKLVGK